MPQEMSNFFTEEQYGRIMRMLNKEKVEEHTANMAGNDDSNLLKDYRDPWVIVTGATDHMASDRNMLYDVVKLPELRRCNVSLPNGKSVPVTYQGSYNLTGDDTIHDDLYTGRVKGIGKEKGGLYLLIPRKTEKYKETQKIRICLVAGVKVDVGTWHRRLGHIPVAVMKKLDFLKTKEFLGCSLNNCTFGKVIKMLRTDNGAEFFSKDCKDFLSSYGVLHQSSCPHTPQQNGVVERRHRHILEVARALRFQGSIPLHFWGDCMLTVVYLINRVPSSILGGRYPYEVFHKSKPSLLHLKVMGCLCYSTVTEKIDKFSPRAIAAVHMGHSVSQKGYRLYNLKVKRFFVCRDVTF
ncbi:PREDICTED: uncharacterized protein LOC109207735 [Nicotiana attenuata]|uniref:uncharacterized protein LOC109207735 n=1 Tax=Nicotiana attenuata TaxID=49451 RepID=UPI000905D241|nr:PREDICTED: uncharacterized protein LOC109207735 [Nicotiana attenuata]